MDKRTIDILVAIHVMEFEPIFDTGAIISFETEFGTLFFSDGDDNEWSPSTDIQDAWLVVEKLDFPVKVTKNTVVEPKYQTHVFIPDNVKMVFSDSAPMAICLAALKSVGVEV
jgi:hypothetical protein